MDIFSGLFLAISFLLLEILKLSRHEIKVFHCQYIRELVRTNYKSTLLRNTHVSQPLNLRDNLSNFQHHNLANRLSDRGERTEFDCWRSHLTDKSRYRLFIFFDQYRAQIANASCHYCELNNLRKYNNIFRMVSFPASDLKQIHGRVNILKRFGKLI